MADALSQQSITGPWVDDLVREWITVMPCHDEPMPGSWLCRCFYMNAGSLCTKCGRYRWESQAQPAWVGVPGWLLSDLADEAGFDPADCC